jgi:sorting nexin-9/18/33
MGKRAFFQLPVSYTIQLKKMKKKIFTFSCFILDVEEIKAPSRPLSIATAPPQNSLYSNETADDPWSTAEPVIPPSFQNATANQQQQHRYDYSNEDNYEYDSDFDDDDTGSRYNQPTSGHTGNYPQARLPPVPSDDSVSQSNAPLSRKTSRMFAKSSDPGYIMGTSNVSVPESEQVNIYLNEQGFYYWKPLDNRYTVTVASPKMESKFKGIKKFIAYNVTPSFNNDPVSRRYKNFDWLHERLVEKFCLIAIPPLPDKQISGRYEEQFIEHRRAQLQQFVDWVCRHPVLSKCEVWMHFLTCKDQKKWKAGKRTAEKDPVS